MLVLVGMQGEIPLYDPIGRTIKKIKTRFSAQKFPIWDYFFIFSKKKIEVVAKRYCVSSGKSIPIVNSN